MQLPIIGQVENKIEHLNLIERMERKKNGNYDTVEYLAATVESLPEENILFSVNSEAEKQLGKLLEEKVKKVHMTASIQSDADALEQAKFADGVIVCVRKGKT